MKEFIHQLFISIKVAAVTLAVCSGLYMLAVLCFAQVFTPYTAQGSMILNGKGEVIGSELIAQGFTNEKYLWPRPSAVGYDASSSGGANLSPASQVLRDRALDIIEMYSITNGAKITPDLVTMSGSGLDPHITLKAALLQVKRIAESRNIGADIVENIINKHAFVPGLIFNNEPLVNVLSVNIDLDKTEPDTKTEKKEL